MNVASFVIWVKVEKVRRAWGGAWIKTGFLMYLKFLYFEI